MPPIAIFGFIIVVVAFGAFFRVFGALERAVGRIARIEAKLDELLRQQHADLRSVTPATDGPSPALVGESSSTAARVGQPSGLDAPQAEPIVRDVSRGRTIQHGG